MNEISLHILDIVQNSIAAKAGHILIEVMEDTRRDCLTVTIADDGSGMDEETAEKVQDPFTTSRKTRKVGLGIPLFREGCLGCEGDFRIVSKPGSGTTVTGSYKTVPYRQTADGEPGGYGVHAGCFKPCVGVHIPAQRR